MKIIVKNIGGKVTADSLAAVFATYGNVLASTIVSDATKTTEGLTALVTMADEKEAATAIEQLNGCFVDGKTWLVTAAAPAASPSVRSYYRKVRGLLSPSPKTVSNLI